MSEAANADPPASPRSSQPRQSNNSGHPNFRRDVPASFSKLYGIEVDLGGVGFDEVSSYLNSNFAADLSLGLTRELGPAANLYRKTNPELNKKGSRIAWVEHAKTGELVPVVIQGGVAVDNVDAEDGRNDKSDESVHGEQEDSATALLLPKPLLGPSAATGVGGVDGAQSFPNSSSQQSSRSYAEYIALIRSAFLFSQGLFAGFCFTSICTESAVTGDLDFLISYQPNAMQFRRLLYFLSTLSLVGSFDTTMTIISRVSQQMASRRSRSRAEGGFDSDEGGGFFTSLLRALGSAREGLTVVVAILVMIVHAIAFLCTVIMTQVDTIVAVRGGAGPSTPGTVWAAELLAVSGFQSQLNSWRTLDQVRLITAVLAWFGCCVLSWKNLSAVEGKNDELMGLKYAVQEWQHRVDLMEGNEGLDTLNKQELAKLVALQKIGLDRAQTALKAARESAQNQTAAAAAAAALDNV